MAEEQEVQEKIAEKIKRLLALSESSNVYEAELAAAKAAELMARYNLSRGQLHYETTGHDVTHRTFDTRVAQDHVGGGDWMRLLYARLSKVFYCSAIYIGNVDVWKGNVVIVGRENDIAAVEAMFTWLMMQVVILATKIEYPPRTHKKAYRESWFIGVVDGVYQRMKEFSDEESKKFASAGAIVRVIDDQNEVKVRELFPNLGRHIAPRVGNGYYAGQKAAGSLQVHESVGGGSKSSSLGSGVKKLGGG